jgi:hypothetical protein
LYLVTGVQTCALPIWHAGSFDYDVLAHAINERYVEHGLNHPVPYFDELR